MAQKLELAEVIKALREELNLAKRDGERQGIRFNINNVDIELQTVVERKVDAGVSGKVRFWVIDADAKANGELKDAVTQKIKLSLQVVDESNPDPQTGKAGVAQISTRK
ncbi:MAG: hypothetical protein QJT81_13880 [Candidatus Thiothrix putei]|uniref:Trypsin-co-occurring domain-containing protein n=1 Tax=Candidatus Thiothrix putei TaxID=3080811 RepID=A0AA95KHY5_9GAMM|nr:MAG: hypothetical protein QJT81_13880 [Candidatus Thiothrix putei]